MTALSSASPSLSATAERRNVVTTYDILKSLAVIIMIIDHLGYYFFPSHDWLRAVGRVGFPVWFFLIGHARSRTVDYRLIGGALVLIAADAALARAAFPLNALVTMVLLRLTIDPLMRLIGQNETKLIVATGVLAVLFPFTNLYWEYGTLAMIFAICGYLARHKFQNDMLIPYLYGGICLALFTFSMRQFFEFSDLLTVFVAVFTGAMMTALFLYLPRKDKTGLNLEAAWIKQPLQFMGSRTLEIYVVHLVLFKILFALRCGCIHCTCYPHFDPMALIAA